MGPAGQPANPKPLRRGCLGTLRDRDAAPWAFAATSRRFRALVDHRGSLVLFSVAPTDGPAPWPLNLSGEPWPLSLDGTSLVPRWRALVAEPWWGALVASPGGEPRWRTLLAVSLGR